MVTIISLLIIAIALVSLSLKFVFDRADDDVFFQQAGLATLVTGAGTLILGQYLFLSNRSSLIKLYRPQLAHWRHGTRSVNEHHLPLRQASI